MAQKPTTPAKPNPTAAKESPVSRSFIRNDFPVIRKAIITLGICIAFGVALKGGSGFLLAKQEARNDQAQIELRQAKGKYTAAENEKNEIHDFQPKYVQLVERGFVGDEKRLDVIERIRHIQEDHKFLPITYEILPQQVFQIDPSIQTGELELRGSKLVVHMALLHEMELSTFLTDLSTHGMFIPQECSIKPSEFAKLSALSAELQGECTLYWVTMGRHAAAEGEAPQVPAQ
jgi:hypothetical protein